MATTGGKTPTSVSAEEKHSITNDGDFEKDLAHVEHKIADAPLADYSGARIVKSGAEKRLVKKLDMYIMPTLWFMYWFNYLDRNAIAVARLNYLEEDLNLKGTQYNTAVSILTVGYLLGQIPSNMILTRVRPSWYMAGFMMLWAIVSTLTAVVHDYTGLVLVRFFLGIVEAPYYPGALYILTIFYTRKELAARISILYSGNILATAFAGLIAAGVFEGLDGAVGLSGWRWLFIIQGIATFLIAIVACFTLPDEPLTTRWLTPEERQLAHERVEEDVVGGKTGSSTWTGLKEGITDPKVWVFIFLQHMHLATNGFKNFFPTIVETLGFDTTITLVLTCPPYLIAGVISIYWSWSSGRYNERTWHITISKIVAIVGFVLACSTLNMPARYVSMCIFAIGTYGVNSILLAWVGSTCGQTKEKKASVMAIVNMSSSISFTWTAYLWPASQAPRYILPMASSAAFSLAVIVGTWFMRWVLKRANRKIRQSDDEATLFYSY